MLKSRYDYILKKINNAKNPVFLTGAGVSTHSGIPDYRSSNGVYNTSLKKCFNKDYYNENKEEVTKLIIDELNIGNCKANVIHKWISTYEKSKVITQNIDGLHQSVGSDTIAFHGYVDESKNLNMTFFGDEIKEDVFRASVEVMKNADLVVVLGTTYNVAPFSLLTTYCEKCFDYIYINLTEPMHKEDFGTILIDDIKNIAEYAISIGGNNNVF